MIEIKIDVGEVRKGIANMAKAHLWGPFIINREMRWLGNEGAAAMREAIAANYYKGTLSDSIRGEYDPATKELTIGPTAKRRNWDAGSILEDGTGAISNVPWKPIREWAFARGMNLKQAGAVWHKIKTSGVGAHPFVERTVNSARFQSALNKVADKIGRDMAAEVFKTDSSVVAGEG